MVSTKLVDGQGSAAWNGWSLSLVEVHRGRVAPGARGNVIHGSFGAPGQRDWAVLCSRNGTSVILVYWGGPARCPSEFRPAADKSFLQTVGDGRIGFSRGINTTNSYHEYPDENDTTSVDREVRLEHDAIDDAFEGKASTVVFCRNGKWIFFSGAD